MTVYRIEFTIQRATADDEDFVDIGFGSSGSWSTVDHAVYILASAVQNREWETTSGMPDPDEVDQ